MSNNNKVAANLTDAICELMNEIIDVAPDEQMVKIIDRKRDEITCSVAVGSVVGTGIVYGMTRNKEGNTGTIAAATMGALMTLGSTTMKNSDVVKVAKQSRNSPATVGVGSAVVTVGTGLLFSAIFD